MKVKEPMGHNKGPVQPSKQIDIFKNQLGKLDL